MKKRINSIQFNLFSTYSVIIIVLTIIFVSFFYFYVSNLLRNNTMESLEELSISISQKLDLEIQKLDDLSMNVLYSNLVKEQFSDYLSQYNVSGESQPGSKVEYYNNIKNLTDVLVALIGPSQTVQQVNLYDFEGHMIGAGVYNKENVLDVKQKSWYTKVLSREGRKYIRLPHKDPLLGEVINYYQDKYYISLYRLFFDQYNIQQGIVEVIQDSDTIFSGIDELLQKEPDERQIYIYNEQGKLVYPYKDIESSECDYYYNIIKNTTDSEDLLNVENPEDGSRELINYSYSDYTGWSVVVVAKENKLLSPLFFFSKMTIYGTIVILLMALGLSYFASKRLTIPIKKMHETINNMDIEMLSSEKQLELNSGVNELEELNMAFKQMNTKLKNSMDKLLQAQSHEMHARMLALQSQMNPHFLYNTLTNISIMAEENMNEQIVTMCENLSYMLRYISNDGPSLVKTAAELEYTEKYLSCMKVRYGNKLKYDIKIDGGLYDIEIPKLLIQPLVENSVKYGIKNEPPWKIIINGEINEASWQILIKDNGPGFSTEEIDRFWERVSEIEEKEGPPGLELEGMGLLNIYMRLRLTYGNEMSFAITEGDNGGAVVKIGGLISVQDRDLIQGGS